MSRRPVPVERRMLEVVEIPILPDLRVEVYWRRDEAGEGPAASVIAHGVEVLRLDLFGADAGHLHFDTGAGVGTRLWFPEGTTEEHIERGAFELGHNLRAYLQISRDERCNRLGDVGAFDPDLVRTAAEEAKATMLRMLEAHRPPD